MNREGFSPKPRVFISYARKDGEEFATQLRKRLEAQEPEISLWQDRAEMEGGVGWWKQIEEAIDQVRFLVIVMTPAAMQSEMTRKEWRYARQRGVNVYPVKGCPDTQLDYTSLPKWMAKAHFFDLHKEWETFVNYLKSDREPKRVAFMVPDVPEGFIQRPREFEQLIAELVDLKHENPIAITTALQGAGGYGKTTLAIALCHDDRVIDAFDDGILWVTLGQHPNVLAELTKLFEALTGDRPAFVDEKDAELKLREKLENRNCLLVIDDAWQRSRLEPFLQGGKKTCARLITTRRLDLVMDAKRIHVDEMRPEESGALLATRVSKENRPRDLRPFHRLAARLMDWPLLLKLAAGVIGARLERNDTLEGAVDYVSRAYEKRGLTAFDPKDAEKRNDAVAKSIQASLELLDQDERTRLTELAIFPEDTDVPLRLVELLWGIDDIDAQDTAKRLADFALLDLDLRAGIVRLHDEIRLFFRRAIASEEAVNLHARLVDRLGNPKEIQDRYALRWLPWHLAKAGRDAERRALLVNFEWMMAKLTGTGIQSLITDYDYLPKESDLRTVQSVLRHSAHILAGNPQELPGQLIGRLPGSLTLDIDALRNQVSEHKGFPWLRPANASITPLDPSLFRVLEGHTHSVNAVALAPKLLRAISGSLDKTLRVWNLETGQTVRTLIGHTESVNAVALTPDGLRAISGSLDKTLRVWNLESGQTVRILVGHTESVNAVALAPDGLRAISGSWDNTLRIWDLETGQSLKTLKEHTDRVGAVALTQDGRIAVSGSWDNTLRVWDLEKGQSLKTLRGHSNHVTSVAFTPDGRIVVSGSWDKTLRVWNLESGQTLYTLQGHTDKVNAVALTHDGHRAVSTSDDHTLRLWDLETCQTIRAFEGHTDSVLAVAVTRDDSYAVSGSGDKRMRLWDLKIRRPLESLPTLKRSVNDLVLTPNGSLALSASDDGTLRIWNSDNGQTVRTLEGHTWSVYAVAVTPECRRAVSASGDHTLRLWDLSTGQTIRTLEGHTDSVIAVAVMSDGRYAISASYDKTLRLWNLESGQTVHILEGHKDKVNAVAITPKGRRAISASDDRTLRLWNLDTGQIIWTLEGHGKLVRDVAITADGRYAVSASYDTTLRLWDLETGRTVKTLVGHSNYVRTLAVTADARLVVSGSSDRTLRIWDLESGECTNTLHGHKDRVNAVALTQDGRYAVSGSGDGSLRVWNLDGHNELLAFTIDAIVTACLVAPDNRTIVVGDGFGRVHFLRLIEPEETKPAPKDIKIQLQLQRQQSNKPENPTMPPPARDQVFISYSHKDNKWRDDLDTHLKPYLRDGSIKSWSDKQISPGSQWFTEIETALTNTQVAVLLVTPDFIASDFVHEHELGPFLKGAKEGGVRILWVAVRASSYKKTALKDYQAVLDPSQPLANMTGAERDHAWVKICEEIEEAVKARNPQ